MKNVLFLLCVVLSFTAPLLGQAGSMGMVDPYSTGLAKTYTATTRGIYAVGINPANLAFSSERHWELTFLPFPNLSMRLGSDFLTINEFNYFFGGVTDANGNKTGRYLNTDDKEHMLTLFREGGTFLVDMAALDFGYMYKPSASFGAVAFVVQDIFSTKFKFPSGVFDLLLYGNPVGKEYSFNDFKFETWYLRSYNFSYAREFNNLWPTLFPQLSVGFGVKYISGFGYAGLKSINAKLITNPDRSITETGDISFRSAYSPDFGFSYDFDSTGQKSGGGFNGFPGGAGSGVGFDIGISGALSNRLRFGIAVTDIGSITWKENSAEYSSSSSFTLNDATDIELRDSLTQAFKPKGKFADAFETDLPTTFRFGIAYEVVASRVTLSFDYNQPLSESLRNSLQGRFSFGLEADIVRWLPYLRMGYSYDGGDLSSLTLGGGMNWGPVEMNFAAPDVQYIFTPKDGKRVSFASGVRLKFN